MPVQTQVRPPATSTGTPEQAPSPTGGRVDRMQNAVGNQAIQERLGIGAKVSEGTASAQAALDATTQSASVSVHGRLAKNAWFADTDDNTLIAWASTQFSVGISRALVWARFDPELLIVPGSLLAQAATGGVGLSKMEYDFQRGKATLGVDLGFAGDLLDPFLGVKAEIEGAFEKAVRDVLPADLRAGGYDPYTDSALPQRLGEIATSLTAAFPAQAPAEGAAEGAGGPERKGTTTEQLLKRVTDPEIRASVRAKAMEVPLDGGFKLRIEDGATLELAVRLAGNLGDALAEPKLRDVLLRTKDIHLVHEDAGLLGGLTLRTIRFGPDLSVTELDYSLGAETLAAVLARAGGSSTNAGSIRAMRDPIDAGARQAIPTLLREQVRHLAAEMPGIPLAGLVAPPQG